MNKCGTCVERMGCVLVHSGSEGCGDYKQEEYMKRTSILQNWKIEDRGAYYSLLGAIFGDDRFYDGEVVRTSMLLSIDFEHGRAETINTIYLLR